MDHFWQWRKQAEKAVKAKKIDPTDVDPDAYWQAFLAGSSPVAFATSASAHVMTPQRKHQAAQQELYGANSGIGTCPNCGSPNLVQFDDYGSQHNHRANLEGLGALFFLGGAVTLCLGFGMILMAIGFVLFIVGLCMPAKWKVGTSRECRYCRTRWRV